MSTFFVRFSLLILELFKALFLPRFLCTFFGTGYKVYSWEELTDHQTVSTQFFAGLSLTVDQSQDSKIVHKFWNIFSRKHYLRRLIPDICHIFYTTTI